MLLGRQKALSRVVKLQPEQVRRPGACVTGQTEHKLQRTKAGLQTNVLIMSAAGDLVRQSAKDKPLYDGSFLPSFFNAEAFFALGVSDKSL